MLIINQCNDKIGFYEWWNVESDIRRMAKNFPNTFSVGIFACCREIYRPTKHCGLFGGTEEAALEYFNRVAPVEVEAESARDSITKDVISKRKNEREAQKFKQIQAIEEDKLKSKCK